MTNNKEIFFVFLFAGYLTVSAFGQPNLLGGAGTSSAHGWKFYASYFIEPKLLPGQHLSIAGQTDVMHTEAKDGRPVIFHRFFTDPESRTYRGYDVEVEPTEKAGSALLRFKPFSLRADQLPQQYSLFTERTHRSAKRSDWGCAEEAAGTSHPGCQSLSELSAELGIAVVEHVAMTAQIARFLVHRVARHLCHPLLGRMARDACQADAPRLQMHEQQDVARHQASPRQHFDRD
jgi:hypothetical protein